MPFTAQYHSICYHYVSYCNFLRRGSLHACTYCCTVSKILMTFSRHFLSIQQQQQQHSLALIIGDLLITRPAKVQQNR
jgi:hypothetical protein